MRRGILLAAFALACWLGASTKAPGTKRIMVLNETKREILPSALSMKPTTSFFTSVADLVNKALSLPWLDSTIESSTLRVQKLEGEVKK
ncbi:MAG: hypothetical protein RR996_01865 [Alistipes sp.]